MGPHLKNTVRAAVFCAGLLIGGALLLFHTSAESVDPLVVLLQLPAPPPPNPAVPKMTGVHDDAFYRRDNPPPDNAPIDDLIDYWGRQTDVRATGLGQHAAPSERVLQRLLNEMGARPSIATKILAVLPPDNKDATQAVRGAYERLAARADDDETTAGVAAELKEWLKYNSPYYTGDLQAVAAKAKDTSNHYVDGNTEKSMLALARHDWEHAGPIVSQLYGDRTQPATQVLATWALYRHALDTDSSSDIERYRSELMHIVEDRTLPDGVRDKANDAIAMEKDFPGREEWTISLFEDETLVKMPQYTMLTTLMNSSPSENFVPRLVELLGKTNKPIVRAAAVRNLMTALGPTGGDSEQEQEIVKAMLPWLEDPKWADDASDDRATIVRRLSQMKMSEAVPGLIKVLEEKRTVATPGYGANSSIGVANMSSNRPRSAYRATNTANAATGISGADYAARLGAIEQYPYRSEAIQALGKQQDARAVPALRRALNSVPDYERHPAVQAIFNCNGFSVQEQLEAVDTAVDAIRSQQSLTAAKIEANGGSPYSANTYQEMALASIDTTGGGNRTGPPSPFEIRTLLGQVLIGGGAQISDELARGVVDKITALDKQDPALAAAYRAFVMAWPNGPVNLLFLKDLKRGTATSEVIIRLLATRKELRQLQQSDVYDLRTGVPRAIGLAACMLEDKADYETILDAGQPDAKTALLACARLIRAELNVAKVIPLLEAKQPLLATAAERYLIAEDSPTARKTVLARHPGDAIVLGARSNFEGTSESGYSDPGPWLAALFTSMGSDAMYYGWGGTSSEGELATIEDNLRKEVKKDDSLVGIYSFDKNYVRIYHDRVMFSWDDDESRYYERPMTHDEFEEIKSYLAAKNADELPPFVYCGGGYCTARELIMLSRNGGRRVYIAGQPEAPGDGDFFTGLDRYFNELKKSPASLKYSLSRDIPGLEIALADDDIEAKTVWKGADELRIAACSASVRARVDKEIEKAAPIDTPATDETPPEDLNAGNLYRRRERLIEQREFEGCSWHRVVGGKTTDFTAQPPDVEYIPIRDGMPAQPTQEQWKARVGPAEIRAGSDGLYSIAHGQATLISKGDFSYPVAGSGRWVVALKADPEEGSQIVRIDLVTRKVYPTELDDNSDMMRPVVYVPSVDRVLIMPLSDHEMDENGDISDPDVPIDVNANGLYLLDPRTGKVSSTNGEMRPLAQQTFRSLQHTSNNSTYWAAIPDSDKRTTVVGTYDAGNFKFTPVLNVPKIVFDSMGMWVDEPGHKVFFVYRGHLLALPFTAAVPAAPPTPHRSPVNRRR